jgi:hypothetical protein
MVDKEQAERLLSLGLELIQTGAAIIAILEWKRRRQAKEESPSKPRSRRKRKRK